jgi:hypothetical protein
MSTPGGGMVIRDGKMAWSGMFTPRNGGNKWSYAWEISPNLKNPQGEKIK